MKSRCFFVLASANMFIAIATGAFGAHGLKHLLTPDMLQIWQTAVTYQVMHALGLFIIGLMLAKWPSRLLVRAGQCLFAGIILFSGSLYLLALTGIRSLGMVTPVGGTLFLAGWLLVMVFAIRHKELAS